MNSQWSQVSVEIFTTQEASAIDYYVIDWQIILSLEDLEAQTLQPHILDPMIHVFFQSRPPAVSLIWLGLRNHHPKRKRHC